MGAIDINTFEIEFIERTQSIIRDYQGEYEFSLLMNCLLSLIVLTCERIKGGGSVAFQVLIDDFDELKSIAAKPQFVFERSLKFKHISGCVFILTNKGRSVPCRASVAANNFVFWVYRCVCEAVSHTLDEVFQSFTLWVSP